MELPDSIVTVFLQAGWTPSRRATVPATVPNSHPAHLVLSCFGGLTVGACGPGVECAASDIRFGFFDSAPEEVAEWSRLLRTELVEIAEYHHDHGALYLDSSGRVFSLSLIHDAFGFEGETFPVAAERVLHGRCARPLLHPGQERVSYYGIEYHRGDPRIYTYE
jgi:hypothetical protein